MTLLKCYLNIIVVCFGLIHNASPHPQCLDYRPPFDVQADLEFCTEYASYGCCNKDRDREIRARFESITNALLANIQNCGDYIKDILCQECSPYAAHIYDAELNEERPFPGLCDGYCRNFYNQCISTLPYISDNIQLLSTVNSVQTFCDYVALTDDSYCYPDLLTNDILNGDIDREAITGEGCLCLEQFASGLRNPLSFESPKDDSGRIFISEQVGVVHIYYKNGTRLQRPFMDITERVLTSNGAGDERGFLGLTFHPNFKTNRKFYIFFSMRQSNGRHATRISELRASDTDPNQVDYTYEKILLEVEQPFSNHNGGAILFGDDGYLYLFLGDGGAGGDPRGYAQNKNVLLGKALRIDVDSPPDQGLQYKIPDDNPFVHEPNTRGEIYAYGIRNIWRCDVDDGDPQTGENKGRIICGDVGQSRYEEIDIIESGGNYGWNLREGFQCYRSSPCDHTGPQILPIYAYSHSVGKSVTGGHVYRGCLNPNLNGKYIYGDFVVGKLFYLYESDNGWNNQEISMCGPDVCFNGLISNYQRNILSFGEDNDGEIYMLTTNYASPGNAMGNVYKIIDPRRRGDPSSCRSFSAPSDGGTSDDCLVVDLTIALDSSGSVRESGWQKLLQFSKDLLHEMQISSTCVRVAMISFGTEGYLYSLLNKTATMEDLVTVINEMPFRDEWTNTGAAFALMTSLVYKATNGDRDSAKNIAIVVTDGPSNRERIYTVPNAQVAVSQGIEILTIGIGPYVDEEELQQITNNVNRNVYVNNFDSLLANTFIEKMINQLTEIAGVDDGIEEAVTMGVFGFAWSCSFEDSNGNGIWCDITQALDDQFNWTLSREPTPSEPTGPDVAFSGEYYVFIEATGRQPGDQAKLNLPQVPTTGRYCLSFAYHMFGWHIDTLFVYKVSVNSEPEIVWSKTKEQGNSWLNASLSIALSQNEHIMFVGRRGDEYSGDIGLDSIQLISGIC